MATQPRATEHVAETPFGEVDDLREDRTRPKRFFRSKVLLHLPAQRGVAVAEAPEEPGAGGTGRTGYQDRELASVERLRGRRGQRRDHGERVWWCCGTAHLERTQILLIELPHPSIRLQRLAEAAKQPLIARAEGRARGPILRRGQVDALEER